jgi:undecaprenyl-diphosphatase
MIPVFVVGVFFKDQVEGLFGSINVVGAALVVTALLLFFSDYASRPGRKSVFPENASRNGISYWQAFAVGLGQAFAVVPGLSRSGTTISTGLICGVRREVMAQFSFLMVLVPILGETFLEIVGGEFGASSVGALQLVLGFVSAFLSGLFACKVMIALVKRARLSWFALYCLIAAASIFIFA